MNKQAHDIRLLRKKKKQWGSYRLKSSKILLWIKASQKTW